MFDSIYLSVKCPHCQQNTLMECQTKDLECELTNYKLNDVLDEKNEYLDESCKFLITNAQCLSEKCYIVPTDEQRKTMNLPEYVSNIKRTFLTVKVFLDNKRITGDYEIIEKY